MGHDIERSVAKSHKNRKYLKCFRSFARTTEAFFCYSNLLPTILTNDRSNQPFFAEPVTADCVA
jgi:hypothetical protein